MQETLAKIDRMKTVRTFPHVIRNAAEECDNASAITRHCIDGISKISLETAGMAATQLAILGNLANSLSDRAECLRGVLYDDDDVCPERMEMLEDI